MICYVPQSIKDAVKSRPDWPEIEAAMKRAYGSNWRLVSCDEPMHPAEAGEMEDSMEHEYISRKELIAWLMPYVHMGEKVDPEALIADIRAMKGAEAAPVVHGKWDDSLDGITPYCSVCGCTHKCLIRTPLYCPNCGAKMDKED